MAVTRNGTRPMWAALRRRSQHGLVMTWDGVGRPPLRGSFCDLCLRQAGPSPLPPGPAPSLCKDATVQTRKKTQRMGTAGGLYTRCPFGIMGGVTGGRGAPWMFLLPFRLRASCYAPLMKWKGRWPPGLSMTRDSERVSLPAMTPPDSALPQPSFIYPSQHFPDPGPTLIQL